MASEVKKYWYNITRKRKFRNLSYGAEFVDLGWLMRKDGYEFAEPIKKLFDVKNEIDWDIRCKECVKDGHVIFYNDVDIFIRQLLIHKPF